QIILFSDALHQELKVVRDFLFDRMYRAPSVVRMRKEVTGVVRDLFPYFLEHPERLPRRWREDVEKVDGETELARIVSDYIAGITDRFAFQCHEKFIVEKMR
ncbi:MAG: deoxyguanosinetriphosphate triphosphohydrolase, partial [Boseongicola sp.]|nr:deoxyguanosinetriphosphate triphosphohydrolase [Boseongicola sp.]